MRILFVILLLFSMCFAQDDISPDTLLTFENGFGWYATITKNTWPEAWQGDLQVPFGSCDTAYEAQPDVGDNIIIRSEYVFFKYTHSRAFVMFNTVGIISPMKQIDSCKIMVPAIGVLRADDDSLWAVEMIPIDTSDCSESHSHLGISCNFSRCGDSTFKVQSGDGWCIPDSGWNSIWFDPDYVDLQDTTVIGLMTRRTAGSAPTGTNIVTTDGYDVLGDSISMLVYYYSRKYNDISHQDNADGISPDTIQFICSIAGDDIASPSYWSRAATDWNLSPSNDDDAFRGERMFAFCCDTSRCGQVNRAMQPHIEASLYGNNIYWMRRANFLMELEESIPDTAELDSMRFYCKFQYVHVDEGDSLFIVTYTPRDTSGDECYINYHGDWDAVHDYFAYPIISGGSAAPTKWCNFYQCGDYKIWGDIPDRSYGRVPEYLAWTWFPIHPSIIDFHTASIGDTFGIGLILKDENSAAPTDTNDISIWDGVDCPYIVYWFSEKDTEKGFINWGLRPHHLGWGLPINQARRMYGGGKGR